jgi:hypothetical protein
MSVMDVVAWLLAPLAGIVVGLRMRWSSLAMLVGLALVITSVVVWGNSVDNYSNNDCQPGEPCPTGERVIRVVNPIFFLLGSALFLVAFGRALWADLRGLRR